MKNLFMLLILTFSVFHLFSQNSDYPQTKRSTFVFTIENITDQPQLDKLQADVEKIKGISEIKIICKWETGKGQLIFTYSEFISGTENGENPDLAVIKHIILENNLGLVDIKIK